MNEFTNMRSLITALARALNLINPAIEHHHEQTAYLAFQIGYEMGLRGDNLNYTVYAALLHDIGSVVSPDQESLAEVEAHRHETAAIGAQMLQGLEGFSVISRIIETNQNSYTENSRLFGDYCNSDVCIDISQAIHIADVVSTLLEPGVPILNQVERIRSAVDRCVGTEFSEKAAAAFDKCASREFMWMDLALNPSFLLIFTGDIKKVSLDETVKLTSLMSRIIDYRSSFTAMHSAGVSASATELARLSGMTEDECKMMKVAGYLHDVGKLRVPNSILEKPGKLTAEEFNIIKEHPYYTRLILMDVDGFERIANWAGFHHEKLDGNGYPFHFRAEDLDLGSRIMAVADIFSAITEVRPYRDGMDHDSAMRVLWEDVDSGAIDGDLVKLLEENYETVDSERDRESRDAGARYFSTIGQ